MFGAYNGLKTKIEELEENEKYIHFAAHNLNLVLNDPVKEVPELAEFLI